jgi:hypothetical protein
MSMQEDRPNQSPSAPGSQAAAHATRALEQAARYATAMAIARWSAPVGTAEPEGFSARAAWLASTQEHLQQWFDDGGFKAGGLDTGEAGAALPFPGSRPCFYTLFRNARSTAE